MRTNETETGKGGEKEMTKYYLPVARYFLSTTVLTGFAMMFMMFN
jgi:hypothetical protein